jgi:hypothetical protein
MVDLSKTVPENSGFNGAVFCSIILQIVSLGFNTGAGPEQPLLEDFNETAGTRGQGSL